ncbi:MAG: hypothetical protein ABR881_24410 [Candidatus Sulfotelmatobacter sp.]
MDRLAQFRSDGQTGSNPPRTKAGFTVLPTLDGDNWRNQGSAAPKIAGEVVKSSWLRIQSVNRVFGLTLTLKNGIRFGPVTKGLENLPNGVKGTSYIDCPCHHASDRQYRSHAFYRAQRHQWEVGLSSPNRILDKSRKHCGAATSFWHQRLHLKAQSTAFYRTL